MQIITIENHEEYMNQMSGNSKTKEVEKIPEPLPNLSIAINFKRMKVLFTFLCLLILDQMLEGNDKIPSILGIKK